MDRLSPVLASPMAGTRIVTDLVLERTQLKAWEARMAAEMGAGSSVSRRRILSVGAAGLGGVALAACGAGQQAPAVAGRDLTANLLFWHGGGGDVEMAPKR